MRKLIARGRAADPVSADAVLLTALSIALSGFGGLFWVIAGRLHSASTVGVAATLIAAMVVLPYAAQLGLDRTLLGSLPRSERPASDVLTSVAISAAVAFVLGVAYALVLPVLAPETGPALHGWRALVFGLIVLGGSVNVTTDSVFLSLRRVHENLAISGVGMGVLKCALLFAFVAFGAFGVAQAVGFAAVAAGVASIAVLLRVMPCTDGWGHSSAFRSEFAVGFSSYLANLVDFLPILTIPVILVAEVGSKENAVFFIAFQIMLVVNALGYAVCNAAFAESARSPERIAHAIRHAAKVVAVVVGLAALAVAVLAVPLLTIYGSHYAGHGATTLRILAVAAPFVAAAYWAQTVMRLRRRLASTIGISLACAGGATVLTATFAHDGAAAAAVAYLVAHVVGAVLGLLLVVSVKGESA